MEMVEVSEDAPEIYKIAYEQGFSGLGLQNSDLAAIRQRATALISISGLAASLLGREALEVPSGNAWWLNIGSYEWVALASLCVSVVCTIEILRPRGGWVSHVAPLKIVSQFAHGEMASDLSTTYRTLAEFSHQNFEKNKTILKTLYRWFNISLIALVLQIIFWMMSIR